MPAVAIIEMLEPGGGDNLEEGRDLRRMYLSRKTFASTRQPGEMNQETASVRISEVGKTADVTSRTWIR